MKQNWAVPLWLLLLVAAFAAPAAARRRETGFLNRLVTVGGVEYRYQVYVPADWTKSKKWPVILFLHGAGERGTDGLVQTEVGIGTALRRYPDRVPAIVVMPQCRTGVWWTDPAMEAQVLEALEQSIQEFNGDRERIYLTGVSMGGYGTWAFAAKHPGKFAALVPICGGVVPPPAIRKTLNAPDVDRASNPYQQVVEKIGKTPVWVFHGAEDPAVPVSESRNMVEALKSAGGNVRYTEYEGVGHRSWENAYAEPELFQWLLSQRLGK